MFEVPEILVAALTVFVFGAGFMVLTLAISLLLFIFRR